MTESAELMLDAARQQNCPYWLLAGRLHERPQPQTLHYWIFPRTSAALSQQVCVAFLALPTDQQAQAEYNGTTLQEWQLPAVHMGWFVHEAAARAWLFRRRV